ncbi:MAG TPA: hypothetical protein ENK11_10425, partial [Phycisphaerales bacterium]|nr:hypothetical protein [Phycisphaerales bacterium]
MRKQTRFGVACALCINGVLLLPAAIAQPFNEVMKIVPADNESPDWFGYSVAIDDGVLPENV